MIKIQLFGPFQVSREGEPIPSDHWKQEKTKNLLKILASEPGKVFKRDELIDWLWPEADPDKARRTLNLHSALCERGSVYLELCNALAVYPCPRLAQPTRSIAVGSGDFTPTNPVSRAP